MSERRCCGPLCQHPACWISGRLEMIEAFNKVALLESSRVRTSRHTSEDRKLVQSMQESLPTLKVVNLLESKDDIYYGCDDTNLAFDIPPQTPHTAARPLKNPRSNCITPFPSIASHCFMKKEKPKRHTESNIFKGEIGSKNQTTCITIQRDGNDRANFDAMKMPCLIWIPSKKSNWKRKNTTFDSSATRKVEAPKVHKKNITGNNSEFGFLTTPFNKEGSVKCYSRATHTVRSSPTRLHPRRLPPISREHTERSSPSKDFRLSGDGMITSMRVTPGLGTPQNTRISMFTGGKPEDCDSELSDGEDTEVVKERFSLNLAGIDRENVVEHYTSSDTKTVLKLAREKSFSKEAREEIMLTRVSLPKDKLKELIIKDHCRNSVPSHQLFDIQMQPICGTESTISNHSVEKKDERTFSAGYVHDDMKLGTNEETYDSYENGINGNVGDVHSDVVSREDIISATGWMEQLQTPLPTPTSPTKQTTNDIHGDIDVIDLIRQEQERAVKIESKSMNRMIGDGFRRSKVLPIASSPAPSKSSSGDWSIDKDIMKQTYERYRSFTPFKMQQISLGDGRLASIREASREYTFMTVREKSLVAKRAKITSLSRHIQRLTPQYFKVEAETMRNLKNYPERVNHFILNMKSVSVRKPQVENINEIFISKMTPRRRSIKSKVAKERHSIKQSQSYALPVEVTSFNSYRERLSAHAIYQAPVDSQNTQDDSSGLGRVAVPGPMHGVTDPKESPDRTEHMPYQGSDSNYSDVDYVNINWNGDDAEGTSEEPKTTVVSDGNNFNDKDNDVFVVGNTDNSFTQLTLNQTNARDITISSGLVADASPRNSYTGNISPYIVEKEAFNKECPEAEGEFQHEKQSQENQFPNECDKDQVKNDDQVKNHMEVNGHSSIPTANHGSRLTSSTGDGKTDTDYSINLESQLDFLSFSPELDLSLDLEGIRKEFDQL